MNPIAEDILMHYGTKRHSGRYPWGSGSDPYQHGGDFLARVDELKKQGKSEKEIAKTIGLTTTQLRVQVSLANNERRQILVERARSLREDGLSLNEIAEKMGYANDSSVRSLLNEKSQARMNEAMKTAEFIKKRVDEVGMVDVGAGVEKELGVSKEKLKEALYILELEGYNTFGGRVPQTTDPSKQTTLKVICPPDTPYKTIVDENGNTKKVSSAIYNYGDIHTLRDYISYDGGETFKQAFVYPESLDSKRLKIRYAEDGGIHKDGVIELRKGVEDISLGNSHYSQVRILVDGTHYLKGMAIYSDDLPDGVDVLFNTNKKRGTPMCGPKDNTVLKNIKNDPDNPFGSSIKEHGGQRYYIDKDGNEKLSLINKTREEGDWDRWAKELPSQFLSKQNMSLIKRQLSLSEYDKLSEYKDILAINNPTVKKALLKDFADNCDSAAVHLQAAALPRQKYQVILPVPSMKDNEIYAPNYKNGEQVALVRYPHGGTFEIPILTVNNKHSKARSSLGNALDAVGINSKVAERLSGADFDGDTVMVIPTGKNVKIKSTPSLSGLEGFDPKLQYGGKPEGSYKRMTKHQTQTEMGKISNLITDMTLKGANKDELARAVRHSMVVIDAEKHGLDYKSSEIDNGISALKSKYQGRISSDGRYHEGASTLISQASAETHVLKRKGSPTINIKGSKDYNPKKPEGSLLYKEVVEEYTDKKGKKQIRKITSTKMAETDDARTLSSGTEQEEAYASYANKMKALANSARKEMVKTKEISYSASAKETYSNEYKSLKAKLDIAEKNAPKERQAQTIANAIVKAKKQDNPDITKEEITKIGTHALTNARNSLGAHKETIKINDREWEAIQAGAISPSMLRRIVSNSDLDVLKEKATPRSVSTLSTAKVNKIKQMYDSGNYTISQIAESIGVSSSTISKQLKGEE